METEHFAKHRATEVQTSDAGPGVSSHERITQIRLSESFQIHNLDLQALLQMTQEATLLKRLCAYLYQLYILQNWKAHMSCWQ